KYATPVNGMKVIRIDTFNEFGEATGIEPTREEGFIYLEGLKGILYEDVMGSPEISRASEMPKTPGAQNNQPQI
ncbi:MAG: hypothetical protein LM573_03740, partial [Thermofilum sp.]|nr:hypothetical protein [Thermofilum sp.]